MVTWLCVGGYVVVGLLVVMGLVWQADEDRQLWRDVAGFEEDVQDD